MAYRMRSLALRANPQGWRSFIERKEDKDFLKIAKKVYKRDKLECQYCGVLMKEGQEVVSLDGCYTNNKLSNLVTACPFCAQCGFLESIGPATYGGGTLVYLPEMTQECVNGLCYSLFKAIQDETEEEEMAQQVYRSLSARAELVEKHLGDGMSDPNVFGQLLVESALHPEKDTFVADLRLLPMRSAFKEHIAHGWAEESTG